MKHIKRNSESNNSQLSIEKLQGGYIFRFNETLVNKENINGVTTNYVCEEYFFNELPTIIEVEEITTYNLNEIQILFIINESIVPPLLVPITTLSELKLHKISEFEPILNDFALLIGRAKIISDGSQILNNIIESIKLIKNETFNTINNFETIVDLSKYKFNTENIDSIKVLLKQSLF